jgi:hypothetical protein
MVVRASRWSFVGDGGGEDPEEVVATADVFDGVAIVVHKYLGNGEFIIRSVTVSCVREHGAEAGAVTVHETGFIGNLVSPEGVLGPLAVRTAWPNEHCDMGVV